MNARPVVTAVGTGMTTAVLVGVSLTAILEEPIEFSAIIGLPVGLLAGAVALVVVPAALDRYDTALGRVLGAYAAFGYAVVGCMALRYANAAGARRTLGLSRIIGVAAIVAVVVYAGLWSADRELAG